MTKRKGTWIKVRKQNEYTPEGKEAVRSQHEKIAKAGEMIKERCTGKKGKEFRRCRSEVMREVFGEKKEAKK